MITAVVLLMASKSYSQITIHEKNVEVQKVFKSIELQSKFTFLYDSQDINNIPKVTVNLTNGSIQDALSQVFKNLPLTYKIIAQTILVKKEQDKAEDKDQKKNISPKQAPIIVRGTVVDENLLPVKNVTISEPALNTVSVTNANGEFKIQGGEAGFILLSAAGFVKKAVDYADTTYLKIELEKGDNKSIDLTEVKIESNDAKLYPTKFVNLENRNYMNLAQVLQGTIPGLSLQVVNTSTKTITSIDAYSNRLNGQPFMNYTRYTVEEFLSTYGKTQGQQIIDLLLKGTNIPASISLLYHLNTVTTITNALVPEIRGASNFGSNTSNMLVVIDGFPQDGFPANYPMTNVESIEVVKDPKELIKWGSRAAGGAILIRSKQAKAGQLQVNYTTSLYFSPAPVFNRSQLKLADSRTYLDYLKDVNTTLSNSYGVTQFNLSPAKQLLSQIKNGVISAAQFDSKWDSLSRLDNEDQMKLLQQSAFNQNHSLTVSGGTQAYKFTAIGNYIGGKTNNLGSKNDTYSLNLSNSFNFFKHKLHINWRINLSDARTKYGYAFSPTNIGMDPYQMLLDGQGNYIYDYTRLSAAGNRLIESRGYKNFGVNLLEDNNVNDLSSIEKNRQSNFNINWNLLPGLTWATSVLYTHRSSESSTLYGAESSYVRQFVNTYGQLSNNGVNFYVPYGDILKANTRTTDNINVRSGLTYSKVLGKHTIGIGVGAGVASITASSPSYPTLYGYNRNTKTSTPVYLPTNPSTQSTITNFYSLFSGASSSAYPFSLTQNMAGDTAVTRNINSNVSLNYSFSDRIKATGLYTTVLNPLYGQSATYSVLSSYNTDVTGLLVKNWNGFLKDVLVSVGANGVQMPNLPGNYTNTRYLQNYWNTYYILVNGATPTQQQGQRSKVLYQKLTLAFADSSIVVNTAYNTQNMSGNLSATNSGNGAAAVPATTKYLSAGLDMFMRKKLLNLHFNYAKSPEGTNQFNGSFNYDIVHENYFKSDRISDLSFSMLLQQISPYQGLALMQSTNVASNGSFSQATNSDFGLLPAASNLFEAHGKISFSDSRYNIDVRYYDQNASGLSNNLAVLTDPSTGLSSQVSFSNIKNRGVEFFFNSVVYKTNNINYNITINGAHNTNIAREVPVTRFTASNEYTLAIREGYDVSNIWAPRWAGLNSSGDPQIYDNNGNVTSVLDSATISTSLVNQGVTKAPWTGGLIQELRFRQLFARVALTFNLGYVMRYYLPYPGNDSETSSLVAERWRKPGDENFTDVPKIGTSGLNSFREFVTRYSSNSILPADNIRLQEVMLGFNLPNKYIKRYGLSSFTMTFQVQNLAFWARNKYHIDPSTVSVDGRIGTTLPRIYSCNLSVSF